MPDAFRDQFREQAASNNSEAEIEDTSVVVTDDGSLGVEVSEDVRVQQQRDAAASELDSQFDGVDIGSGNIRLTDEGARLDERTQAEITAQRIVEESDQVGPDGRFGEEDLEFEFEGGELVDVALASEAKQDASSGSGGGEIGSVGDGVGITTSEVGAGSNGSNQSSSSESEQDDGFTVVESGEDWPTTPDEAVSVGADLLTGDGAELIETDAPTNRREVSQAIISARRERLGLDIDPIDPGDAADNAVDRVTNFGGEEGALVAAGVGVVTPEPSTTAVGGAILIGAAGAAVLSSGSELDVGQPNQDVSEVETGEPGERTVSEVEVTDPDVTELEVGEFAPDTSEVQVGDPTSTESEVNVPSVETQQVVTDSELLEEADNRDESVNRDGPIIIGEEDIEDTGPLVEIPEDEQQKQIREEHERRQEFAREDTNYDQVERDFPTGGDAVVGNSTETSVDEDVGAPEVEPGYEFDDPADTSVSTGVGGSGDDVGVGPDVWYEVAERSEMIDRSAPEDVTDVAIDTSVGNAPMSEVYSASPAQAFATPSPQGFGYDPLAANAYANPTSQPSRTRQSRSPSRPPFPGFESAPEQPEAGGNSPFNIQITNPVATATDVLGVGAGAEMAAASSDSTPVEDDFEDEWSSGAGFGSFEGWGGDFDGADFDDAGFDSAAFDGADFDGADMWDADNWEADQGGQGDPFGGFS